MIADVVARVVNRHHDRIGLQPGQCEIEPEMSILEMDHIRPKTANLLQQSGDDCELPQWLPQPRLFKRPVSDGRVQQRLIFLGIFLGQHQQQIALACQTVGLLDAVLGEIER